MTLDRYLRGGDPRAVQERRFRAEGRLPAGQSLTLKWPVLHAGDEPAFDAATWTFRVGGLVESPFTLSWADFKALPGVAVTSDFHCVTRWSRMDNRWEGVGFRTLLARAKAQAAATHVMVVGHLGEERYGYSANLALADLDRDDVLFAWAHDGAPLHVEHGGPLRLVVPHLYAWKSVKWARGLVFMDEDRLGYWERRGYHARGDPWREERLASLPR
jgi:DMSO/TMAO reductase YedYZ molybdopterin-dependent catalytic subunit